MLATMWCLMFSCSTVTTNDVFYRIFKRSIDDYIDVQSGNAEELYKHIDPSQPTAFYIHGWKESCHNASAIEVSSAILSRGGYNVCCLDWSGLADDNYMVAAPSTQEVATIFSNDIIEMCDFGFEPEHMNVCGFSLGAHIAGTVGKNLQIAAYRNLGKITALDPAKPLFDPLICPRCRRLESTDADMVYTIHTSSGIYGITSPTGKCDIYPNYGSTIQKGCPIIPETLDPTLFMPTYRCSHDRSWKFYGDAIRHPNSHMAIKCNSSQSFASNSCSKHTRIPIGLDMPNDISGTYYYMTKAEFPYGEGVLGTTFSNP